MGGVTSLQLLCDQQLPPNVPLFALTINTKRRHKRHRNFRHEASRDIITRPLEGGGVGRGGGQSEQCSKFLSGGELKLGSHLRRFRLQTPIKLHCNAEWIFNESYSDAAIRGQPCTFCPFSSIYFKPLRSNARFLSEDCDEKHKQLQKKNIWLIGKVI